MGRTVLRLGSLLGLLAGVALSAQAAPSVVLNADLPALIDQVAQQRERFAVEVPHQFTTSTVGEWTTAGSMRAWTYSVRVPTAVSMSFHASRLALPPSAVLTVTGVRASIAYHAGDVKRGELWGRPLTGDTLTFSLSVPAIDAAIVQLEVDGLQAGYRGLGGLPSHPYFLQLAKQNAGGTQSCQENYSCDASSANSGPARATVAVLVGNQFQCTGTLLNDTASDLTPYVLTGRHCQTGMLGGGDPQAAASVTVYWDAVTACGTTLGSIYDSAIMTQSGATTVVEQQDAWLIRLDGPPVAADAFWAGWDATGGAFNGGYSVHHALGFDKQFVSWYGQALLQNVPGATLNVGYASSFWGLVNQLGSVGAGASGGAVFDPNEHVVGSATLAALQNGPNSAGVCPLSPPSAPAPSTVTADYTALSAVFASTADTTSSTSGATLKSVLDPGGTGKLVIDGVSVLPVTLTASSSSPTTFQTLSLSWNVAGAQSCTATGGVSGDGWAGVRAIAGSATIVNYSGGTVSYTLSCTAGGQIGQSTVSIDWIYFAPSIDLSGPPAAVALGSAVGLFWSANVSPCVASGGVSGDGWAGNKTIQGQQNVTALQLGTTTYTLTCGSGPRLTTKQTMVTVVPLSVTITSNATQVRIGSTVWLYWTSAGTSYNCSGAGGGPGDNWALNVSLNSPGESFLTETVPGTYTYTINCSGGGQSSSSSVLVTWTNDPPTLSLVAVMPTEQIYQYLTPIQPPTDLIWSSNFASCYIGAAGPLGNTSVTLAGNYPSGTAADAEFMAGLYTYTLTCGLNSATASIQWTTSNPQVTLTAPTTTWVANYPYPVVWSTNTQPCTETGGVAGDGWGVNYVAGQASQNVTEALPGTYVYTLTCGTGSSIGQAQLQVTVPPPAVTIQATPASVPVNSVMTLNWNSTLAPCTSVDASGGVNWGGGNVSPSGSIPVIETAMGTIKYSITCGTGNQTVHASTQVIVTAPVPTTISANPGTTVVDTPVTLTWNANSAYVCTATGGTGSDGWSGTQAASGTATVSSTVAELVTYGISCGSTQAQTQVNYTAPIGTFTANPTPSVSLSSNMPSQIPGQSVALNWTAKNSDSCVASGGTAGDGWTGNLSLSGSMQITEQNAGTVNYGITCSGAPPAATAAVSVDFAEPAASAGGSGHTGGGGGTMDLITLYLLILAVIRQFVRGPVIGRSKARKATLQLVPDT